MWSKRVSAVFLEVLRGESGPLVLAICGIDIIGTLSSCEVLEIILGHLLSFVPEIGDFGAADSKPTSDRGLGLKPNHRSVSFSAYLEVPQSSQQFRLSHHLHSNAGHTA